MTLQRTTSENPHFQYLSNELEQELKLRDGDQHIFYAELNKIDNLPYVIVAYKDGLPVGCGGLREYNKNVVEIKRMFVKPQHRGHKIATAILTELEKWSAALGYRYCLLETGKNQPEAMGLYAKNKYTVIPNFGKYADSENSICFEKAIQVI